MIPTTLTTLALSSQAVPLTNDLQSKHIQKSSLLLHLVSHYSCNKQSEKQQVPTVLHTLVAYKGIMTLRHWSHNRLCFDTTIVTPLLIYPRFININQSFKHISRGVTILIIQNITKAIIMLFTEELIK